MYALIPCAGSGARAGSSEPKQYRDIAGLPMVIHTLRAFNAVARIKQGLVVVAPDDIVMTVLLQKHGLDNFQVAEVGGAVGVGDAAPKAALAPHAALAQPALEVVGAGHVERALAGAADAVERAAVFG
jgi:bifunctional N-acetylglucosamine-1-phosphate-uridyltransferase/glucosamine-1-phosphate-acetyltransferase GlmU-like protein